MNPQYSPLTPPAIALILAAVIAPLASCSISSRTPTSMTNRDVDALLSAPSLLVEAQIPTIEMFSDEPLEIDLAPWLKGWGFTVDSISAPPGLKVEWLAEARPPALGERYSYGELLRLWTPAQSLTGPDPELDRIELRLMQQGVSTVKTLGRLRLTPGPGAPPLAPVTLHLRGTGGSHIVDVSLLVRIVTLPRVEFTYTPAKPIKRAAVAGTFNAWNKNTTELTGPGPDGAYSATVRMKPGRYEYKFVVDDEWIPDPANPRQSADGFRNSILDVEGTEAAPPLDVIAIPSPDKAHWAFAVLRNGRPGTMAEAMVWHGNAPLAEGAVELAPGVLGVPRAALTGCARDLRLAVRSAENVWSETLLPREEQFLPDSPARTHHHLIYFAMTDRFHDGNPANNAPIDDPELTPLTNFHGGDFAGISRKIRDGYFDALGVTAIWISSPNKSTPKAEYDSLPPHRKFSAYHGYWPISPDETDPRFGTMDELRELTAAARKHGITIIFDFVGNHTHADHPYYREHPEWFGVLELPDGRRNIRLFDEFPMSTWFDTFLPSFNFVHSPEAIEQVTADAVWWLRETGAGGFRHDATKHMPYEFWMRLTERLWEEIEAPAGERLLQVGETISDRDLILSFVGPAMMTGQFDFPLYWRVRDAFAFENIPLSDLAFEARQSQRVYGKKARMSPFAGNHDFSRFMAFATGAVPPDMTQQEKEIGWTKPPSVSDPNDYDKLRLALTFVLTLPGAPLIYYGDEFGMTGAGDPDNRRPMRFGKDLTAAERHNLDYTRKLATIRRSVSALWRGDFLPLLAEADTLAYLRTDTESAAIVVLNRARRPRHLTLTLPEPLAGGAWQSLLTGQVVEAAGTKISVSVKPRMAEILLQTRP